MKTRYIKTVAVLFFSMLMVTAVIAQRPYQGKRGQGPCGAGEGPAYGMRYHSDSIGRNEKMSPMSCLDLTEEQQTAFTELRTQHFKAVTPLRNKMAELKARERTLISEEVVDKKALDKTIDEQSELSGTIRKLQVEQQLAIKALLSDEQLMKLQQGRNFARQEGFHGKGARRGYRGI